MTEEYTRTIKKHPRYPLIEMVTFKFKGHTSRSVWRSRDYNNKWYAKLLPRLYARQVGKAFTWNWINKGKSLMELPYSINDVNETQEIIDEHGKHCLNINTPEGYALRKGHKNKDVDTDAITKAEIEED